MPRMPSTRRALRPATRGIRCGGRSARVVEAVLQATTAELARSGYEALRIEDVASRAGVNKTTIYRRWPTKAELVAAALCSCDDACKEAPDTGSLRRDLLELLRETSNRMTAPERRGVARVMMTEVAHPEVASIGLTLRREFFARWRTVIRRAASRGELPARSDAELICQTIAGVVLMRLLQFGEELDDAFLLSVVDLVLVGAKNGGAVGSPRRPSRRRDARGDRSASARTRATV
jgi:AcrR family transcriptional regulator